MPVKGDPLNKGIERPECTGGPSFIMSGQCRAVSNNRPIEKYLSAPASVRTTVSSTIFGDGSLHLEVQDRKKEN